MQSQTAVLNDYEVEYCLRSRMVVFSHGFGVRRDSRGMFKDIAASLPSDVGYVLFDYDEPSGGHLRATYATEQVRKLKQVLDWAGRQQGVTDVGIVAHSRGCLIAAMAHVHPMSFVVMLAPPLVQGHARQYFTQKPGTIKKGDDWYVPRSDGTTTVIPEGVIAEFDHLQREKLLLDYAAVQPLLAIIAGSDAVLGRQDYSHLEANPNVSIATVPSASHDFTGSARQPMLQLIRDYINKRA